MEVKKRKQRSDSKKDLKPTVDIELKEALARIAYITDTPIKDVAATFIEKGLISRKVLESLSSHYRRSLRLGNTFFMGSLDSKPIKRTSVGNTERISTRLPQHTYENLANLAYALNVTPSTAGAILLERAVRHSEILNIYVRSYLTEEVDERRMVELKRVLRYLNMNNPYAEKVSWFSFLSILRENGQGTGTLSDVVQQFLDKWRTL